MVFILLFCFANNALETVNLSCEIQDYTNIRKGKGNDRELFCIGFTHLLSRQMAKNAIKQVHTYTSCLFDEYSISDVIYIHGGNIAGNVTVG